MRDILERHCLPDKISISVNCNRTKVAFCCLVITWLGRALVICNKSIERITTNHKQLYRSRGLNSFEFHHRSNLLRSLFDPMITFHQSLCWINCESRFWRGWKKGATSIRLYFSLWFNLPLSLFCESTSLDSIRRRCRMRMECWHADCILAYTSVTALAHHDM